MHKSEAPTGLLPHPIIVSVYSVWKRGIHQKILLAGYFIMLREQCALLSVKGHKLGQKHKTKALDAFPDTFMERL